MTKEQYDKYCKGEIKFNDLIKVLGTTRYKLEKQFTELGYQHRRKVLNETTKHDFFDIIDSELKAYLLGFYFADGSISSNRISLALNKDDEEIVKLFQKEIGPYFKITYSNEHKNKKTGYITRPMCNISIYSENICKKLTEYGIGHNKTINSNFNFDIIPKKLMIHFIRGYFDGDGVVCETKVTRAIKGKEYKYTNYNWSILSNRKENIIPIKEFLENEYGIKSNILNNRRGHYLIEVNKKEDFFLLREILYNNSNYFLKRKKDKYFKILKTPNKNKRKVIKQYNDKIVKIFESAEEAGRDENITGSGIAVRIKHRLNINGYTWNYYDKIN